MKDTGHAVIEQSASRLLYDPAKAAQLLDVSRSRLYEWLAEGRIKSLKIGKSRRITRAALEEFVRSLENGDAAA